MRLNTWTTTVMDGDNQSGNNLTRTNDSDNDGYDNSVDQFPNPTQHEDLDGDGRDNTPGTAADPSPTTRTTTAPTIPLTCSRPMPRKTPTLTATATATTSRHNPDPSPTTATTTGSPTTTTPSRGTPPNHRQRRRRMGRQLPGHPADAFPNEPSQWKDSDGDGRSDNANGTNETPSRTMRRSGRIQTAMATATTRTATFPTPTPTTRRSGLTATATATATTTPTRSTYHGPSQPNGRCLPLDGTQWSDLDGDGYGDNMTGNAYDEYLYDPPSGWTPTATVCPTITATPSTRRRV